MFSNLSKGNILYGLDRKEGNMKYFTATIEETKPTIPMKVGQTFGTVLDITAIYNGNPVHFQQVPCGDAIMDYGNNSYLLADSRDSLVNYINAKLQASKNIVDSYEENKQLVEKYESILAEINPSTNSKELNELKQQMSTMQSQFSELMTLLKGKQNT